MKILIVCQQYAPDNFRINEISKELAARGHRVTVLTGLPDYATGRVPEEYRHGRRRDEMIDGVHVIRKPIVARRTGVLWRGLNYLSFLFSSTWYATFCKEKDYDVIVCYQLSPITMANAAVKMKKRTGKKLCLYCLDLWPESLKAWHVKESSPLFKCVHSYSKKIYAHCDRIGITSQPFREYLTKVNHVSDDKIVYLPQHADRVPIPDKPLPQPGEPIHLGFCGNVGSVQDVACIVRAAKELSDLPQVHLDIYGDGSELENCKALARELEVENAVHFHGRVPLETLHKKFESLDGFLLTLKAEGFVGATMPAKLQEYMAAGKPVFGAIGGAAAQVIEQAECGRVCPPSDYKALGQAIREFAENPQAFAACGKNARRYFEEYFTLEAFMQGFEKLLDC